MCDTLAIAARDRVWFAKNSDRDPNEAQLLEWHPRRAWGPGAVVGCTWIEIPQVACTHAVLISRPFWMWGAEMGTNEHGLTIGNEAVFTREPYAASGLTGMDLLRLALERCSSADQAVELIVELLTVYGQGGGCGLENRRFTYHNSFLVADPRGAIVLETAGRRWAAEAVRGARSISNGLTIAGFARRHGDFVRTTVSACRARQAQTQAAAQRAEGPADLAAVLRSHGPAGGPPVYHWHNGAMSAPCMHAGGLIAAAQTTASWIAELRREGCRHWVTATAAPCTSIFFPVRVDEPLDLGPAPGETADEASYWWQHERLHRLACREWSEQVPRLAAQRDDLEQAWFAAPGNPAEAVAQCQRWRRCCLGKLGSNGSAAAGRPPVDRRPAIARRYWERRDRRAGIWQTAAANGA